MPVPKTDRKIPKGSKTAKPGKKKPFKGTRGSWLWLWLGLTGVAMLSATAGALLAVSLSTTPLLQHKLSPEEAAVFESDRMTRTSMKLSELTRPVNILVLGIKVTAADLSNPPPETKDLSYDPLVDSFDGLADTMLLIRFNPETRKITVLSIPRDSKIFLDGYKMMKINATNVEGGASLAAKAVSNLLEDVPIDRYVRINVQGIEKLIDALGGVSVYIPKDMKYTDATQHLYIDLKEGQQHLTGDQVLQLLRFRYDKLGDLGRIQRQQMVMGALTEQALNAGTLAKLPKLLSVVQSHIDTNLSVEELMALVGFGVQTKRSNIQMTIMPGDFNGDGKHETSYWLPNRRQIKALMAKHFDQGYIDRQPTNPNRMRIAIQDSTGKPEAVQALVKKLQTTGYRNVYIDEAWKEPLKATKIIAQKGDDDNAQAIRRALGLGEVRVESTGNVISDISIQLGQDWLNQMQTEPIPNDQFIKP